MRHLNMPFRKSDPSKRYNGQPELVHEKNRCFSENLSDKGPNHVGDVQEGGVARQYETDGRTRILSFPEPMPTHPILKNPIDKHGGNSSRKAFLGNYDAVTAHHGALRR